MIKQISKSMQIYVTPEMSVIECQVEGCLASSSPAILQDMGNNSIYDEEF